MRFARFACAPAGALLALSLGLAAGALAGPFPADPVDASLPVAWATEVTSLVRGPNDIADPGGGLAFFGVPENALGPATTNPSDVVSLGDGGQITVTFDLAIFDALGPDFAVFENGFEFGGALFGELAYVEVSSNGVDFARFPSESLTAGPVGAFDPIDPTDVHDLAGAFPQGQGTPFDLLELAAHSLVADGLLDLQGVRFVRMIDVIGDGSTLDSAGRPIFDPYPTAFSSGAGGFDLDAVGILHGAPEPAAGGLLLLAGAALAFLRLRPAST
jgi:hypothetical protein